jgi:alcohol dehydrogenase (cytochrome c)
MHAMKKRMLVSWVTFFSLAIALAAIVAARFLGPPELVWRMQVISAKLRGDLYQIPLGNLIVWLAPGSPTYLEALAANPNPHAAIRNRLTDPDSVRQGRNLFERHCAQCHGATGGGHAGPSLIEAVVVKSDWNFLASAKWGLPGTAMPPAALTDVQIWQIHAFLRSQGLTASSPTAEEPEDTPSRPEVHVEADDLLNAQSRASEWLTYAGNLAGHRHSSLTEITRDNVAQLRLAWAAQLRPVDRELQASPIVANGVMFVTESKEGVVALDAASGAPLWKYRRSVPDDLSLCCGAPNRGAALLGRTVFVGTIDAHLVALDANTGRQRWIAKVADYKEGYSITGAPLALADRVIIGVSGSNFGVRGFLAAYDPADGRLLWRFNTVPGKGEFGNETWKGDSWRTGGATTWTVGAYDASQKLVIWGTGNPAPLFQADARKGDNLFSNSVIALDADSGQLRWYYQFTPGDDHDWDSTQQPILADIEWRGQKRKVVLWANRNAFFYALDRRSGEFLFAKPFVKQTWNEGFDSKGRPKIAASSRPSPAGTLVWPAITSATNWWPPSYDQYRRLVFIPTSDAAGVYYRGKDVRYSKGERFEGSASPPYAPNVRATAFVKAVDAQTGDVRWQTVLASGSGNISTAVGGVLSTRTGLVFAGYRSVFYCFNAEDGRELWRVNLGATVRGSPIAFAVGGKQHIAVAAGHTVNVFRLP